MIILRDSTTFEWTMIKVLVKADISLLTDKITQRDPFSRKLEEEKHFVSSIILLITKNAQ